MANSDENQLSIDKKILLLELISKTRRLEELYIDTIADAVIWQPVRFKINE